MLVLFFFAAGFSITWVLLFSGGGVLSDEDYERSVVGEVSCKLHKWALVSDDASGGGSLVSDGVLALRADGPQEPRMVHRCMTCGMRAGSGSERRRDDEGL